MKKLFFFFSLALFVSCNSYKVKFEIIDISVKQLELMDRVKTMDTVKRSEILIDSIYFPYEQLWNNYLGDRKAFLNWINSKAYNDLEKNIIKAKNFDLKEIKTHLNNIGFEMEKLTGFNVDSRWYIVYGPKWVNFGMFFDNSIVVDLAFENTQTISDIDIYLPHELNHKIYGEVNPSKKRSVVSQVIDEGFACYVTHKFFSGKVTIPQSLAYTKKEYLFCKNNDNKILSLLGNYLDSDDRGDINKFANRAYYFDENHPGAIGYYIGLRIVEEYVKKHGKDSWKDIYILHPMEVIEKSRLLSVIQSKTL